MSNTVFNGDDTIQDEFPNRGKMIRNELRDVNWHIWSDFHAVSQSVHSMDNEGLLLSGMSEQMQLSQKIMDLTNLVPASWNDPETVRRNIARLPEAEVRELHDTFMLVSELSREMETPEFQAGLNRLLNKTTEGAAPVVMGEGAVDGDTGYEVVFVGEDHHLTVT